MKGQPEGRFYPEGLPVLIGSVPLDSHREALDWIFTATPEIPLWPQLPVNPYEQMMPQFSEGIPCIIEENLNTPEGRILYDIEQPGFDEAMLSFYEDYLSAVDDPAALMHSRFQVSRERAAGLFLFADDLNNRQGITAVKGQVTGPFTMLTGIKDRQGRAGYFDATIRDMVTKAIAMKAAWQVRMLTAHCSSPILMFIDEPALAGLGSSAFISVTAEEIQEMTREVVTAIHQAGGLAGIHVCANTDWELLLNTEIDILSFDAYGFFNRIAPLHDALSAYLERGGILAWGGIPTSRSEDIEKESTESLVQLWEEHAEALTKTGHDRASLLRQTCITPSCGTGSLSPDLAQKVLELTRSVSRQLRETYIQPTQ